MVNFVIPIWSNLLSIFWQIRQMESDTDPEQLECLDRFVDFLSRFGFGPKGRTEVGNMEVVFWKDPSKFNKSFVYFPGKLPLKVSGNLQVCLVMGPGHTLHTSSTTAEIISKESCQEHCGETGGPSSFPAVKETVDQYQVFGHEKTWYFEISSPTVFFLKNLGLNPVAFEVKRQWCWCFATRTNSPQFFRVIFATYHDDDRFATFWSLRISLATPRSSAEIWLQLFWIVGDGTIAT